jgi:hypothetical protein
VLHLRANRKRAHAPPASRDVSASEADSGRCGRPLTAA